VERESFPFLFSFHTSGSQKEEYINACVHINPTSENFLGNAFSSQSKSNDQIVPSSSYANVKKHPQFSLSTPTRHRRPSWKKPLLLRKLLRHAEYSRDWLCVPFKNSARSKSPTEWGDFGLDATVRLETTLILSADRNTRMKEEKSF
jgi:hypothetical protein